MATPLFDALQVDLSERLEDAVSSATSNGLRWTSAQRDSFMNQGIRKWLTKWVARFLKGDPRAGDALQNHIVEYSGALASSKLSLTTSGLTTPASGGVLQILEVYNTDDSKFIHPSPRINKLFVQNSLNSFLDEQYWTVNAGSLEVFGSGVAATENITMRFIKGHVNHVAGGGAVTVVSDTAWTASSTTITNFTGTLASHVGSIFAGLDNGANAFSRTIASYVSGTSFTINSALVADGAGTNGYIIPASATTGDLEVPKEWWEEALDMATIIGLESDPDSTNLARATVLEGRNG